MAIRDIFKVSRKTFFDPAGWLDVQGLKQQTTDLIATGKAILTPDISPPQPETFEEACTRLSLTEADLLASQKAFKFYTTLFLICGILMFIYSFFLLFSSLSHILGWILGMSVTAVLFAQAFKYHFWYFQLKQRKLGLTIKDWRTYVLGGRV